MLAILVLITRYVIEFANQVIIELGRHDVYPWFYPEWVKPTARLVSLTVPFVENPTDICCCTPPLPWAMTYPGAQSNRC